MRKTIACDCGWTVTSASEEELVEATAEHAASVHGATLSREQVLAMAQPAPRG